MKDTIRVTPHIEALLQEQLRRGAYHSSEEVIERALETLAQKKSLSLRGGPSTKSPSEAVADIQELRKGVRLDGFEIKDLIREGHKY